MNKIKKSLIILILIVFSIYFTKYIITTNTNSTISEQISNIPVDTSGNSPVSDEFTKAYVSRIVDGDTVEVTIDSKKYKVRFIGINCPEYTSKIEYYGKESTEYTSSMLINKYVFLEKDISETDKYDRLLRYVWLEIPISNSIEEIKSKMFNGLLVSNGYANATIYPPDVKYSIQFNKLASDAKNNNLGLWNKK